jgi:hypothetical protein
MARNMKMMKATSRVNTRQVRKANRMIAAPPVIAGRCHHSGRKILTLLVGIEDRAHRLSVQRSAVVRVEDRAFRFGRWWISVERNVAVRSTRLVVPFNWMVADAVGKQKRRGNCTALWMTLQHAMTFTPLHLCSIFYKPSCR